ncbi:MAG: hypothetical protein ACLGHZ_11230 [Actinomycetes bacterium]
MADVSEVQNLDPDDNLQTNDGVPGAAEAGHVAQGEPRDYADAGEPDHEPGEYLRDGSKEPS